MKNLDALVLAIVVILTACKKDTQINPAKASTGNPVQSLSYVPLTVGNYWIYERFLVDTSGTETSMNTIDSVYINRDTIINGRTYYIFGQNDTTGFNFFPLAGQWLYDSSGCVLYYNHYLFLDPGHINDTLRRDTATYQVVFFYVSENFSSDVVPSGTYSGASTTVYERFLQPSPHNMPAPPQFTRFAQGVGIVHHKIGWVSQPRSGYSWKLLRYHV